MLWNQPELETRDGRHVRDSLLPDKVGMGVWHGKTDTASTYHIPLIYVFTGRKKDGVWGTFKSTFYTSVNDVSLILAI